MFPIPSTITWKPIFLSVSLWYCHPVKWLQIPLGLKSSGELLKSIALSITSDSLVVGEKTLCSVAYAQGKGRKIKELLVRTDRSLWAHYRGKGCCSPGSSMPLSMKCHFMFSSVKLFIFSLPHGSDRCPSDLDKSQEATGAKGLTITSSSTPAFFFFFGSGAQTNGKRLHSTHWITAFGVRNQYEGRFGRYPGTHKDHGVQLLAPHGTT